MKATVAIILFSLISGSALADELDYAQWEQLNKLATDPANKPSYLPNKLQPVTDPNGVFQQVINYNLEEIKKTNSTFKMLDAQWGSHQASAGNTIAAQGTAAEPPSTTYQIKPFETKAWIDFTNRFKATYNYQVVSHTSEFLLTPDKKILGVTIGYSYTITTADSSNKISLRYDW